MKLKILLNLPTLFCACLSFLYTGKVAAQHTNVLSATLYEDLKEVRIQQEFTYLNNSKDTLNTLYFNDWANSYADKNTALAKRFALEFNKSLHLAKDEERGHTTIISAVDDDYRGLQWKHTTGRDIVQIVLNHPLPPQKTVKLFLTYTVKLPSNKFTSYGYSDKKNEYYLKDWYLTPAVYNGKWQLYSNKNLEDLYTDITNTTINFVYPEKLFLATNYDELSGTKFSNSQQLTLKGVHRKSCEIILTPDKRFTTHITPHLTVVSDIEATKYGEISQGISINRVAKFLFTNLGDYPHQQLLVSEIDYNKNPLYGINQLPSFIRPYGEQFQFEMKFLKTALNGYLNESLYLNPRKEKWILDALFNYLMINYVETYYPDQKLLGKLSKIWGIRSFHLGKMDFNDQYALFSMVTARKNQDQSLATPNDSLIKFNQKIANRYKAGLGLAYLADYIGKKNVDTSIKKFYNTYKLNNVKAKDFQNILELATKKNINWFFDDYVNTSERIDFKIKKVIKNDDSLQVVIKNKTGTNVPISMFGLRNDSIVSKYWFTDIKTEKTFTVPRGNEERLVLNYDQKIPEFNQRDNWKSLNGFFSSNKKLKFQFFKDTEDPYYNQVFYVPVLNFNIYDGWSPGIRLYNKTFLERPFVYDFAPSYAPREKAFVGHGRLSFRKYYGKSGLYVTNYSISGSTSHFQANSRYSTLTPSITLGWRPENPLSNKKTALFVRYVNVFRTIDPSLGNLETDPDYSVLNARFGTSNNGIINYFSWFADAQYAGSFSKLSFNLTYRKLFQNNRQFNFRFFAGKFLRNQTNSDFFSFALDRPTDYLFDYGYLGRSEDSGIYSQQIIIAEGGFKSKLENPFANDWITTVNTSMNLWRWVELYGDLGFIKNTGQNERFVYDSGVRLNLVTDYFELYFPVYSNNGWEIAQPNYGEKIRFVVTLSPKTLIKLFTRKWF